MRAALYARVSTHDQQTLGLQTEAMTAYISDRGWNLVKPIKDIGSGAKERGGRELLGVRQEFLYLHFCGSWFDDDVVLGKGCRALEASFV
jgi:hypothetical protein